MKAKSGFLPTTTLALVGLVLTAAGALAAPPAADRDLGPREAPEIRQAAGDALLYVLPDTVPEGRHELEAAFTVDGKPQLTERLSFETVKGGSRTLELLSRNSQQRREILKLARSGRNDVQVSIVLDKELRAYSLESLIHQSGLLQQMGFEALETRPERTSAPRQGDLPALFTKNQAECLAGCDEQYDSCTNNCYVYACIEECQYYRNQCYQSCPPDCTGPTVREYTTRVHESIYWITWGCWDDYWYPYSPKEYYKYYVTDRIDTHRETTQCDGSQTDVIIATNHVSYYCWAKQNWSCSSSSGSPWHLQLCN